MRKCFRFSSLNENDFVALYENGKQMNSCSMLVVLILCSIQCTTLITLKQVAYEHIIEYKFKYFIHSSRASSIPLIFIVWMCLHQHYHFSHFG